MIIILDKSQPGGNCVKEIMHKSTWHTHLFFSHPYASIVQKLKKLPDVFFTHILFYRNNHPNFWWYIYTPPLLDTYIQD